MAEKVNSSPQKPKRVVERNISLLGQLMEYLLARPDILGALPTKFELVILPDDDPEMRLYNLKLLDTLARDGKTIVFARLKSSHTRDWRRAQPNLYVPLAA